MPPHLVYSKKLFIQFILLNIYRIFKSNDRKALKELYSMRKAIMLEREREKNSSVKTDTELLNFSKKYSREIAK